MMLSCQDGEMMDAGYPARLGVLLHDERHSVHQLRRGDRLVIHKVVVLEVGE